jgi:hypothetical protein
MKKQAGLPTDLPTTTLGTKAFSLRRQARRCEVSDLFLTQDAAAAGSGELYGGRDVGHVFLKNMVFKKLDF